MRTQGKQKLKVKPTRKPLEVLADCRASGEDAFPILSRMLESRDPAVRSEAASALGQLGDRRAIQPLLKALDKVARGVSPLRLLLASLALALIAVVLIAISPWVAWNRLPEDLGWGILLLIGALFYLGIRIETIGMTGKAIGQALRRLAETCPSPELRRALPVLKSIEANDLAYSSETRRETRAAADAIELATEELHALPIPGGDQVVSPTTLPRPAREAQPNQNTLPRP